MCKIHEFYEQYQAELDEIIAGLQQKQQQYSDALCQSRVLHQQFRLQNYRRNQHLGAYALFQYNNSQALDVSLYEKLIGLIDNLKCCLEDLSKSSDKEKFSMYPMTLSNTIDQIRLAFQDVNQFLQRQSLEQEEVPNAVTQLEQLLQNIDHPSIGAGL